MLKVLQAAYRILGLSLKAISRATSTDKGTKSVSAIGLVIFLIVVILAGSTPQIMWNVMTHTDSNLNPYTSDEEELGYEEEAIKKEESRFSAIIGETLLKEYEYTVQTIQDKCSNKGVDWGEQQNYIVDNSDMSLLIAASSGEGANTAGEAIAKTAEQYSWPSGTNKKYYCLSADKSAAGYNGYEEMFKRHMKGTDLTYENKTAYLKRGACCCHSANAIVSEALGIEGRLPSLMVLGSDTKKRIEKKGFAVFEWDGKKSSLQRGDILAYQTPSYNHVAIYLGDNKVANGGLTHGNFPYIRKGPHSKSDCSVYNVIRYTGSFTGAGATGGAVSVSEPQSYDKITTLQKLSKRTGTTKNVGISGYNAQSFAYYGNTFYCTFITAGNKGAGGYVIAYDQDGKEKSRSPSQQVLRHGNGTAYSTTENLLYTVTVSGVGDNTKAVKVDPETLKTAGTKSLGHGTSSIAYDRVTNRFITSSGAYNGKASSPGHLYVYDANLKKQVGAKTITRKRWCHPADIAAYNGIIYATVSGASVEAAANYIDMYSEETGNYLGSYECPYAEIEGIDVDDSGQLVLLFHDTQDFLQFTGINVGAATSKNVNVAGSRQATTILSAFSIFESQYMPPDGIGGINEEKGHREINSGGGNVGQLAVEWGKTKAEESKNGKWPYTSFSEGHGACPICHPEKNSKGWQCIGFVTACYFHGAGVPMNVKSKHSGKYCAMGDLGTGGDGSPKGSLHGKTPEEVFEKWKNRNGNNWTMVSTGSLTSKNGLSDSQLQPGDILLCYENGCEVHTAMYAGDGKVLESSGGSMNGGKGGVYYHKGNWTRKRAKVAMRYTGGSPAQSSASGAQSIFDACEEQAKWMKNYTYKWQDNPTIKKSKKYGTCVTYVACVLQRTGALKSGKSLWHNGSGYGNGKVQGATKDMEVIYMNNKTFAQAKSDLKAGDIVMVDDNKSGVAGNGGHIMVFVKYNKNGNPVVYDNSSAGRVKNGESAQHTYSSSRKILAVVRAKSSNGSASDSSSYASDYGDYEGDKDYYLKLAQKLYSYISRDLFPEKTLTKLMKSVESKKGTNFNTLFTVNYGPIVKVNGKKVFAYIEINPISVANTSQKIFGMDPNAPYTSEVKSKKKSLMKSLMSGTEYVIGDTTVQEAIATTRDVHMELIYDDRYYGSLKDVARKIGLPIRGAFTEVAPMTKDFKTDQKGIEFKVKKGEDIIACEDGQVRYRNGYIEILGEHTIRYYNCDPKVADLKFVERGQVIGKTNGTKFRLEVLLDGKPIDPEPLMKHSIGASAGLANFSGSGILGHPVDPKKYQIQTDGLFGATEGGHMEVHGGVDMEVFHSYVSGGKGPEIAASEAGKVILAGQNGGYGNCVVIQHSNGMETLYGHMHSITVSRGQQVSRGQIIGYVGSTGHSYGPHLHFEVRVNGRRVDPLKFLKYNKVNKKEIRKNFYVYTFS